MGNLPSQGTCAFTRTPGHVSETSTRHGTRTRTPGHVSGTCTRTPEHETCDGTWVMYRQVVHLPDMGHVPSPVLCRSRISTGPMSRYSGTCPTSRVVQLQFNSHVPCPVDVQLLGTEPMCQHKSHAPMSSYMSRCPRTFPLPQCGCPTSRYMSCVPLQV